MFDELHRAVWWIVGAIVLAFVLTVLTISIPTWDIWRMHRDILTWHQLIESRLDTIDTCARREVPSSLSTPGP